MLKFSRKFLMFLPFPEKKSWVACAWRIPTEYCLEQVNISRKSCGNTLLFEAEDVAKPVKEVTQTPCKVFAIFQYISLYKNTFKEF